jgi:PEP-CTERM motif
MRTWKNAFVRCSVIAAVASGSSLMTQSVKAAIVGSTSSDSSWAAGTLAFETGAAPQTGSGGATEDNNSWGGNANGVNGFGALAEAFEPSVSGTLTAAQLDFAGAAATFNVEIYNYGPAPANWASATAGSAPTVTQLNNVPVNYPNLLAAGDQFTFNGTGGTTLQTLTFTGADASVSLVAGDVYVLSLDPTAAADSTWWVRGGTPIAAFNTGEGFNADGVAGLGNFEGKTSIRDFDTAVAVTVPEPTSIGLLGLAAAGLLGRRRKTA